MKLSNSMKRIQPFSKKGANLLLDIPAINGEVRSENILGQQYVGTGFTTEPEASHRPADSANCASRNPPCRKRLLVSASYPIS